MCVVDGSLMSFFVAFTFCRSDGQLKRSPGFHGEGEGEFPEVAFSFLHRSNSHQITTHSKLQNGRLIAVALMQNSRTEEEKRRNRTQERFARNPSPAPPSRFVPEL